MPAPKSEMPPAGTTAPRKKPPAEKTPKLRPNAVLSWNDAGAPFAEEFGDIYYSKHGGLEETRTVFLHALGLPELWRGNKCSVIGELGFGAGLNALATWDLWRANREPEAILHFISIEGFPLARHDAALALQAFPELSNLAEKLLARWPCRASGLHRLWFEEDGFCLSLIHEEAHDALPLLQGPIDGWLLDGFAPSKNPGMWSADLMKRIAALSAPGARAATYSVAAAVRSGLAEVGFTVERAPGFGQKKERLVATLEKPNAQASLAVRRPRTALVIGGGIAGACIAAALKRRGVAVTLIDEHGLASGASGNPAGIVSPRLDSGDDAPGRLLRAAYLFAVDHYAAEARGAFQARGIVRGETDKTKADKLAQNPNLPEDWFFSTDPAAEGITSPAAFHLPQAGLLNPARAVEIFTQDCVVKTGIEVARIEQSADQWRAFGADNAEIAAADILILANGPGLAALIEPDLLPLEGRRGALSIAALNKPTDSSAISAGAYVFPWNDDLIFGATFDPAPLDQPSSPADDADHHQNHDALAALSPQRAASVSSIETWRGRASVRVTTPDQLPAAGAMPDRTALQPFLEKLKHGAIAESAIAPPAIPGLFMLGALGARGLTTAPLMAEHIACLALSEPSPLPPDQIRLIEPARFLLRKARHNKD